MGRYLIVANQTTGGAELERAIRTRIEAGQNQFYVVVPMIDPGDEAPKREPDAAASTGAPSEPEADATEDPRGRAERRLASMLDKIESLGGEAEGEVGDSDPAEAVQAVVDREVFNEVIISTLPVGISRWLKLDLPSKTRRMVDCPVTTVEADG